MNRFTSAFFAKDQGENGTMIRHSRIISTSAAVLFGIVDSGNGASLAVSDAEQIAEWYTWTTEPGTVPEEKSIIFDGIQYDGIYSHSYGREGRSGLYDEYLMTDQKQGHSFTYERSSGNLIGIDFDSNEHNELTEPFLPVLDNPLVQAEMKADLWAHRLLDNSDEYERTTVAQTDEYFVFRFVRKGSEIKALDYLGIMISNKGSLLIFENFTSGWGKEAEQQLEILKSAPVEELIQAELSKQNASLAEIYSSYYGRTPDGKVVLIVNCSVRVENGMTTGAKFLVGIE